jgi:hypothetical protein
VVLDHEGLHVVGLALLVQLLHQVPVSGWPVVSHACFRNLVMLLHCR